MELEPEQESEISSLIHRLSEGQGDKSEVVSNLEGLATSEGLEPNHISLLMQLVVGDTVGNTRLRCRLVRCLIPSHEVPHSAVIHALGCMGQLPTSLRELLFKWIIIVYDVIDETAPLRYIYDIILHYIQYDSLRQTVCQLLCYITTRQDVKRYRVQRLTEMLRRVHLPQDRDAAESALVALLSVYKILCPHLVSEPLPARPKVWFRPVEKQLAGNIARVRGQRSTSSRQDETSLERLEGCLGCVPPPAKRVKKDLTSCSVVSAPPSRGRVSASSLVSIQDLCRNIHRLDPPQQSAAILESRLLQHVFSLCSGHSLRLRLTNWLEYALSYEVDRYSPMAGAPDVKNSFFPKLLKCLANLTTFLSEPIPTVEGFLPILLESWDGEDYQADVLALLSHLSLQPFEVLEESYLAPLKKLFVTKHLKFKYLTVSTLTSLLRNFVSFEWCRLEQDTSVDDSMRQHYSVFPYDEEAAVDFDPTHTIRQFIRYIEDMLCQVTLEEKPHPLLQHAAASFYELVTALPSETDIPILTIPRPHLVLSTLLSQDAAAISRHMACFVSCKETLSVLQRSERSVEQVATFNSLVLDLCDALWRNLAFVNTSRPYPTLLFRLTSEILTTSNLPRENKDHLSITHHPAFLGHVWKFLNTDAVAPSLTYHPDIVSNSPDLHVKYLGYLQHHQLTGLVYFVRTFLRLAQ